MSNDNNNEPMYCSQQISIPPELPNILKQFTKAAIRTQPSDVLQWASAYFDALAKGEKPPVKERLDFHLGEVQEKVLTLEAIKVLHKQVGDKPIVELSKVEDKWHALCLPQVDLDDIMRAGSFAEEFEWNKFLVLACSHITESIKHALQNVCEVMTTDLQGGRARVDFKVFTQLYKYLAAVDGDIPAQNVTEVIEHLQYEAERQDGMIGPMNFLSDSCPPLSGTN